MGDSNVVFVTQWYNPPPLSVNVAGNVVVNGSGQLMTSSSSNDGDEVTRHHGLVVAVDDQGHGQQQHHHQHAQPVVSEWGNVRLDHLTKQFQTLCVAGGAVQTTAAPSINNAVIPKSLARFRQACAGELHPNYLLFPRSVVLAMNMATFIVFVRR
jgi:hypothetical protein